MKTWLQLQSDDDGIARIQQWHAESPLDITICQVDPTHGRRALEALQVTTRSALGAVAFHTGGILIDDGWLRVLGAGCDTFPRSIDRWNRLDDAPRCPDGLLVADDAIGGFFAWFNAPRAIHYLAPDTAQWECLDLGYEDWLRWAFTDKLSSFYAELRPPSWTTWRTEIGTFNSDRAIHFAPPLWAKGVPFNARSRRAIPIEELWSVANEMKRVLDSDE